MKLVTGAAGLLGYEIVSLDKEAVGITSKDCDLTKNADKISEIHKSHGLKSVIHCAARVGGVKANTDFVANFFDENMKMSMNVFEICKKHELKLVSVLSTCIYPDEMYVTYPLTEDQLHNGPPHQSNFGYAYAKRMLDVQSRAYRQQHNCNFITVVPNNLYGPNDNYDTECGHVIPALIRRFHEAKLNKQESVSIWGSGKPLREFTFARDAAKIILWLTENYDGNQPVNIGNPEQVSIKELALSISELIGYDGKVIFDTTKPEGQFKKPSSNQRLLDLGWKGDYTSLREGLTETVSHFQKVYPRVRGVTVTK